MRVAIIGLGPSGLMLATLLNKFNIDYFAFNSGKIGKKLLQSGNGKCNISNTNIDIKYYHNNELMKKIINNKNKVFDIFKELDIYTKSDNEGRLYPLSESSQSILDIFMSNINKDKIIDLFVEKIDIKNNKYYINEYGPFDKIAIGLGSIANYKTPYNYNCLNSFKLKFNEFKPSLVGFKLKENTKLISGVRSKASVSLYNDNKLIHSEDGEIIFKDDGISGICIMNLSSYYQHLSNIKNPKIYIDLLKNHKYNSLISVINPKLLKYIESNNLDPNKIIFNIKDTYSLEYAQVSKGGIDIKSLNDNLSLKSDKNVYFMGEIIDCDGVCGGYNLFFAFLTSILVAEDLKNEISN